MIHRRIWVIPLVLSGCVRAGFDTNPDGAPMDVLPVADHVLDLRSDRPADSGLPDAFSSQLSCTTPQEVGSNQNGDLINPALRTDGLTLLAMGTTTVYASTRASTGGAFGAWKATLLPFDKRDQSFFAYGDGEKVMVTTNDNPAPRPLQLCPASLTGCQDQAVRYKDSDLLVTADMDGPSVAVLPGGQLLMAHNIGPTGATSGDIYLATLKNPGDIGSGWVTSPVAGLTDPALKEDDPALGPDGLVLIYSVHTGLSTDLMVIRRASTSDPFTAPAPLTAVNSPHLDAGPYLAPMPNGKLELLFHSDRAPTDRIYRSVCTP